MAADLVVGRLRQRPLTIPAPLDTRVVRLDANASPRPRGGAWTVADADSTAGGLAEALGIDVTALRFAVGLDDAVRPAVQSQAWGAARRRIVVGATEASSLRREVGALADIAEIIEARVHPDGTLDLDRLAELLQVPTAAVVVAAADHRSGVVAPLEKVVGAAHAAGAMVVTDATQLPGLLPCEPSRLGADIVLFGERGPTGTIGPLAVVGGPDGGRPRSASAGAAPDADLVQALVIGLIAALATYVPGMSRLASLRDRLEASVISRIPGVEPLGTSVPRLPNTTLLRIMGVDADVLGRLMPQLVGDGVGSEGARAGRSNHALLALGLREDQAQGCVTYSLHPDTSAGDVDGAIAALVTAVPLARSVTLGGDHGE